MSVSDAELMLRCQEGDSVAFDEVVQRYKSQLVNFIYRYIGDQATAEDLAQETFLRLYNSLDRYRSDIAGLRTWLFKIAVNLCKNEIRNRKRRSKTMSNVSVSYADTDENPAANVVDTSLTPDQELEQKEIQQILSKTISELPEKLKTVLILRDIEGLSYKDISRIVRKPEGTVKSRLNRARLMVRDSMMPYM